MPKIVRTGGISLSGDIVKISDVLPLAARARNKPELAARTEEGVFVVPDILEGIAGEEVGINGDGEALLSGDDGWEASSAPRGGVKAEIIQGAMAQAGQILEDAVRKAEAARAEALEAARAEIERTRGAAMAEGRRDGYAAVIEDVKNAADGIERAAAGFEGRLAGFEAECEEQMRWMAAEITEKVLAQKVAEDDAVLADMVAKAVRSVMNEAWVRVNVSQDMAGLVDKLMEMYDGVAGVQVSAVPMDPQTVLVETPSGVVDTSLRTQLANLREYFGVVRQ